ncbi:MAG: hypothetical protein PQJ49_06215 [Sphaerochaetaceae bacterium]|nr:hypothetical protein [Sphaerochaetaceae bacterium]
MALTVKDLREMINQKGLKEDAVVTDMQLRDFVHITHDTEGNIRLCTHRPIGRCNRTGEYVYPSEVEGYAAYCPELDEDLYEFEFTRIDHENGER